MNRIAAFMLLDFRSLPIFGKIGIFIFILCTIGISFDDSTQSAPSIIFPGIILLIPFTQIFTIAEKNRLETLHAALPLTRDDIVKAHYLYFAFILAVFTFPSLLLKLLFFPNNKFLIIAGIFLFASFAAAIMCPLYLKLGSRKASGTMSFLTVAFFIILLTTRSRLEFLALCSRVIPATSAGKAAAGVIFLYLSYLLSLKIYRTRDF